MSDKYANFSELSASEPEGSYKVQLRQMGTAVALIAPHAGGIEPGTSEICRTLAGDDLTYYLFEGCKLHNNSDLHITSSNFDEPRALEVAKSASFVTTIHGQTGSREIVNVGGRAYELGKILIDLLKKADYVAVRSSESLQGLDQNNICNRGKSKEGLQLEISRGLRDRLIREKREMDRFCAVVRTVLHRHSPDRSSQREAPSH